MMSSLWSKPSQDGPKDNADVADTGLADVGLPSPNPQNPPMSAQPGVGRPQLQRNQLQPPPPHQPPPPPAPEQVGNPQDSLTLMQLRRIVTEFPKVEPTSYAFTYSDTATFEEEVDEWFSYNEAEFKRLLRAKDTFERRWKKFDEGPWLAASLEERQEFAKLEAKGLSSPILRTRCKSLQTILHIILGVWDETAGLEAGEPKHEEEIEETGESGEPNGEAEEPKPKTKASNSQLEHMKAGIQLLAQAGGISLLFEVMQNAFKRLW